MSIDNKLIVLRFFLPYVLIQIDLISRHYFFFFIIKERRKLVA